MSTLALIAALVAASVVVIGVFLIACAWAAARRDREMYLGARDRKWWWPDGR